MSFDQVEQLKREWTDRHVVVAAGIPELRRFASRTGQVKTVNMNGRALVQFDSSEDIAWYDIDLSCLKAVEPPAAGKQESAPTKAKAAAPAKAKPSAPAAGGKKLSPLEQARQQGAAGGGSPAKPAAAPADSGGKKLSPLEQARQQGAAGSGSPAKPAAAPADSGGKKLSPLEQARQQGAAGSGGASTPEPKAESAAQSAPAEAETPEAAPAEPEEKPSVPTTGPDGQKLSPLELARLQGAFKG